MQPQIFRVVFEDSALLVIEKCRPFLSQRGDGGAQEGLDEFLSRTRGEKIFPVHRLDREVLGLMVFARTKSAADSVSEQFRERSIQKIYEAEVAGVVSKESDQLVHYLKKNPKTNYVTVFPRPTEGAKRAELTYLVKARNAKSTVVFVSLQTGRTHQIRVQLAKIGHPILGDQRYTRSERNEGTGAEEPAIHLRSVVLGLKHPVSGERFLWNLIGESEMALLREKKLL